MSEKRRVVFLIGTTAGGGIATYIKSINRELEKSYSTQYISIHNKQDINLLNKASIFLLGCLKIIILSIKYKVRKVDLIYHINSGPRGSFFRCLLCTQIAILFKGNIIFHIHSPEMHMFLTKVLNDNVIRKIIIKLFKKVDTFLFVSKQCSNEVIEVLDSNNIDIKDRYTVIYNGIDLSDMKPVKKKDYSDNINVVFVGRLMVNKNTVIIPKLCRKLIDMDCKVRFHIVGDGDEREKLEEQIEIHDAQKFIKLYGWVEHSEVPNILGNMHLFFLPSIWESFGIVIIEAYKNGLPVVASNTGGVPEIVEIGETGYIFDKNDPKEALAILERLIKNPSRIHKLASYTQEYVKKFDINNIINQLIKLYEN